MEVEKKEIVEAIKFHVEMLEELVHKLLCGTYEICTNDEIDIDFDGLKRILGGVRKFDIDFDGLKRILGGVRKFDEGLRIINSGKDMI